MPILMGNKHTPMEGSVAVPLVITGPGVKRGAQVDTPVALDPSYAQTVKMFEAKLNTILDPSEIAELARKEEGLITADGKDLSYEKD